MIISSQLNPYIHNVRIPYAHVDKMGFVYYANYFIYFEMARTEMLRHNNINYRDLEEKGIMLPVLEANCSYTKPAKYDDIISIYTIPLLIKTLKLKITYEVKRDNEVLSKGYTIHVCMSPKGKVLRPPKEFLGFLNDLP